MATDTTPTIAQNIDEGERGGSYKPSTLSVSLVIASPSALVG